MSQSVSQSGGLFSHSKVIGDEYLGHSFSVVFRVTAEKQENQFQNDDNDGGGDEDNDDDVMTMTTR